MKTVSIAFAVVAIVGLTQVAPAQAGCLGGAVVGGLAGHMVGHGGMGAAAGCAVGHHRSATRARERDMNTSNQQQPATTPSRMP